MTDEQARAICQQLKSIENALGFIIVAIVFAAALNYCGATLPGHH